MRQVYPSSMPHLPGGVLVICATWLSKNTDFRLEAGSSNFGQANEGWGASARRKQNTSHDAVGDIHQHLILPNTQAEVNLHCPILSYYAVSYRAHQENTLTPRPSSSATPTAPPALPLPLLLLMEAFLVSRGPCAL